MIRRNFISLDICGGELRGVALRRQGTKTVVLTGAKTTPLPENTWALSVRDANILDRPRFIAAVKATLDPLAGGEDRIALSLPDPIGRILMTEVDSTFKSRQEGVEVVKWQLKKSFPAEAKDMQLDYQVLEKTEAGRYRLLVSMIVRSVLHQYEEVLSEAGYHPVLVDFHSPNLYNYYRSRLDLGNDFILVGIDGNQLGLQFFQGKKPCFHRHKRVVAAPAEVFKEINMSFASIRENYPGFQRAAVFLHCDWAERGALIDALKAAFERDVIVLDPKVERLVVKPLSYGVAVSPNLAAAIGAAERLM
ncbi:type IV pilus biogenesis protein PilM [Trichloromonas sp.]|uniref:type IV pilus biogenesis protein PilM n=1 Tax=Trichloromonas sp. TaxID=3069249 RepID=UPI003D81ACBA